jgi:hypothetical protein
LVAAVTPRKDSRESKLSRKFKYTLARGVGRNGYSIL